MVNPLGHWLQIPFGTITWISLMGISGFRGIGFQISLRGLSCFRVPPGLVVPAYPFPVPFPGLLIFPFIFVLLLYILVFLLYGARLSGVL